MHLEIVIYCIAYTLNNAPLPTKFGASLKPKNRFKLCIYFLPLFV